MRVQPKRSTRIRTSGRTRRIERDRRSTMCSAHGFEMDVTNGRSPTETGYRSRERLSGRRA